MKPYKLYHLIYLPIAALLLIITCYYSVGFAEFEREKDFGKDLRIDLPEYAIAHNQLTEIYESGDESGLFLYDSLAYSVILKSPLPDKSLRAITSERRGWKRVDDETYSLRRSVLSEVMDCTYNVKQNRLSINYLYDFDPFGLILYPIIAAMALGVLYVVLLILLSLLLLVIKGIKKRRAN